jgi:hypothetical protein
LPWHVAGVVVRLEFAVQIIDRLLGCGCAVFVSAAVPPVFPVPPVVVAQGPQQVTVWWSKKILNLRLQLQLKLGALDQLGWNDLNPSPQTLVLPGWPCWSFNSGSAMQTPKRIRRRWINPNDNFY